MQTQSERVYNYNKAKGSNLVLPILFFLVGSVVIFLKAYAMRHELVSVIVWGLAFLSLAYAFVPIWCLTRDQHISLKQTGIIVPKSFLTSAKLEIPYSAISYLASDEQFCSLVFDISAARQTYVIKSERLPSRQAFADICRVLHEKVSENKSRAS